MKEYFDAFRSASLTDDLMRFCEETDKGHGRIETRPRLASTSAPFQAMTPTKFFKPAELLGPSKIGFIGAWMLLSERTKPTSVSVSSLRTSPSSAASP